MPFGNGTAWFCVRGVEPAALAAALRLRTALDANWASGLAGAANGLFVGRRGGFAVAIGGDAWAAGDGEALAAALRQLSTVHGEAFWFGCDPQRDRFGWARARAGAVQRAFVGDGDAGTVDWQEGEITPAERELGFFVDDPRDRSDDPIKWWPTAGDVLALAARWTFDPRQVSSGDGVSTGLLGRW